MRFALSVPPFTDPATVVAMTRDAEAAGWDGVFLWDHLRWDDVVDVHDPWVLLGAMAQETERVLLGTMVTPLTRRRPWTMAKHLVTLDHLSGGRAVFGVGLGDPPDLDFSDFGEEPDYKVKAGILDEGLELLDGWLSEGTARGHGNTYSVDATMRPLPVQRPRVPIWVAGRAPAPRPLARAKRWDGYVPIADPFLQPDDVAALVGDHPREGWELVVQWAPGVPAEAFEAVGVTWLVRSTWPGEDGWVSELRDVAAAAPAPPSD